MQIQFSTFIADSSELIRKNDVLKTIRYVPIVGIVSGGYRALIATIQSMISIAKTMFNIGKKLENQEKLDLFKKKISRGLNEMVPLRMFFGDLKGLREEKTAVKMQSLVRMKNAKQEVQKLREEKAAAKLQEKQQTQSVSFFSTLGKALVENQGGDGDFQSTFGSIDY